VCQRIDLSEELCLFVSRLLGRTAFDVIVIVYAVTRDCWKRYCYDDNYFNNDNNNNTNNNDNTNNKNNDNITDNITSVDNDNIFVSTSFVSINDVNYDKCSDNCSQVDSKSIEWHRGRCQREYWPADWRRRWHRDGGRELLRQRHHYHHMFLLSSTTRSGASGTCR